MGTSTINTPDLDIQDVVEVRLPKKYKVILHNDDFTTMEFVVTVLMVLFNKTEAQALMIANHVHNQGKGIAGIFSKEIAAEKVKDVTSIAKQAGFPLKTTMEEE